MSPAPGLSIRAYAAHRKERGLSGGTLRAVQKALESGRITRTAGKKINPEQADRDWSSNTDQARQAAPQPASRRKKPGSAPGKKRPQPPAPPSEEDSRTGGRYQDARAFNEVIKAKMAHLDYQERAGSLVKKEDVERAAFELARNVRDRLEAIPDRLDAILAAETDHAEVRLTLAGEIRDALQGLSGAGDS